jgi:hypothetical protein
MSRLVLVLTLALFLASCEKELNIKPSNAGDVLVVDASIESGGTPRVILTKSFNYFKTLSVEDLFGAFISGAKVSISNGVLTQQLKEYILPFGSASIVVYSTDTSLGAMQIIGRLKTSYQLTIEVQGKTYTANTSIPDTARRVDSLWWKPAPFNKDTSKVVLLAKVSDPKGLGNYIRYFTRRNDSAFLPGFNSVFDDAFVDGKTYTTQIDAGVNRNVKLNVGEYGFFARGDTVSLKVCNIDKKTFDFWRTWEQNQSNLGNPFSVPIKVLGNISNGALGYFGGYAAQVTTIIIPKN